MKSAAAVPDGYPTAAPKRISPHLVSASNQRQRHREILTGGSLLNRLRVNESTA